MRADTLSTAGRVIGRVLRGGAYSNVVIRHETAGLDPGQGRAVQAVVFDALRRTTEIDDRIATAGRRSVDSIDNEIVDLLRATSAALGDGRTPAPLVVDAAVHATKRLRPRASGFVNAVCRRIAEMGPLGRTGIRATDLGVPEWLLASLSAGWTPDEADRFCQASMQSPGVGVRVRPGASPPEHAVAVDGIADAWITPGGELPDGVVVQDPASTAVGLACRPVTGRLVVDLAAAPGGKARHLADLGAATVVAVDRHHRRARDAARRVPEAVWIAADGERPPLAGQRVDLVLVDAPCSGLGTMRRRPEIRHRVSPEEVRRLAAAQRRLVNAGLELVRPGGRLVYSVCTVTPEETVEVVDGLGGGPPVGLPGRPWGDGWLLAPHLGPTDGMFLWVVER